MTIADRIDYLLQDQDLSRRQLAIKANIPPSSFQSAMERGHNITLDMLQKIADALKLPISYFIGQPPFDNLLLLNEFRGVILFSLEKNGYCDKSLILADLSEYDYIKLVADHITNIERISDSGLNISYKTSGNGDKVDMVNYSTATCKIEFGKQQISLVCAFNILNEEGKKEAIKRVEELTEIPRYQKPKTPK